MKIEINTVRGRRRPRPARRRGSPAVRPLTSSNTETRTRHTRHSAHDSVFTHGSHTRTTKNKVERLPSLRARATVPLSHTHAHTCMVPQRSCAVHGPARALGCPSALRHTATAPNDSLAAATTFATGSPSSSLPEPYRSLPFFWFPCLSSCCRLAGFKEGKLPSCSRARPRSQAVEAASCSRLDRQTFCSRHVRREPSLLGLDVYGSSEPENQP